MAGKYNEIPDFSDLTCTNLMIKMKMLLKRAPAGTPVECFVRRNQKDSVETPFSKSGYDVKIHMDGTNRYRVSLTKREQGMDS